MRSTTSVSTLPHDPGDSQRGTFTGIPTFIRAHCRTASKGGSGGYSEAGFHLGYHVRDLEPYDIETEDWLAVIVFELHPLIEVENDDAVIAWCVRRYPRVMAMVPTRRRASFVAGFYRGFAKGGEL
jgi:hypothetical protein